MERQNIQKAHLQWGVIDISNHETYNRILKEEASQVNPAKRQKITGAHSTNVCFLCKTPEL
jgi:hypothetical protein